VAHVAPFIAVAALLSALNPLMVPVSIIALVHAWAIPELYAARGAKALRRREAAAAAPERRALGLLGDLLDHRTRELAARTGVVEERGRFGVWLVGEAGAVLVRPRARRVNCYCVKVTDPTLPSSDKLSHLLLALRSDEAGFATVANLAFSGARWRLRRRLPAALREALDSAAATALGMSSARPAA
jgi:hypothetical protein